MSLAFKLKDPLPERKTDHFAIRFDDQETKFSQNSDNSEKIR